MESMCIKGFVFLRENLFFFILLKVVLQYRSPISQIPNEILLRLFTYYLNSYDLFNSCIRVNKQWKNLIKEKTVWNIVNPINWAKGSFRKLVVWIYMIICRSMGFEYSIGRNDNG